MVEHSFLSQKNKQMNKKASKPQNMKKWIYQEIKYGFSIWRERKKLQKEKTQGRLKYREK